MKTNYEVTILDQKFVLKTENNEDYVKRVTDYVNKVMFAIKQKSATISTQNVAILGALNIAEDLFAHKDQTKKIVKNWRDRLTTAVKETE